MSSETASLLDLVAILAVVVVVAVVVLVLLLRRAAAHPYEAAGTLLAPGERVLFDALRQALGPEYAVFPKVRLADLLSLRRGLTRKQRAHALEEVAARPVAFVVCDPDSYAIRAVIELEDPTYRRRSRHAPPPFLDTALAAARIPLVRLPPQESYPAGELRDRVLAALRPAAIPTRAGSAARGGTIVGRVRGVHRRHDAPEGAAWLPTRGVLALLAVILIVVAALSWFIEPAERPLPAAAAPPTVDAPVAPAATPADPAPPPAPAPPPKVEGEEAREIVGYREVRVPGRPLEECMGPDREINPDVLRCRDGYMRREPIYR